MKASDFGGAAPPSLWVSGTTYGVGAVVLSPTDYTYYVRIVAGAGTTDPSADTTNWRSAGASGIKSIQRGTLAYNSGSATITSVNTAKTELRLLGSTCSDSGGVPRTPMINLASATSISHSVTFGASGGTTSWELTERY